MANQVMVVFQFAAGVGMILVGIAGEAVWFSWRVQHGGRQSLLMQAIPLGMLYILNGITIYLAGKQETNTVKQGVAQVMSFLSCVAALYILCITADLLAMERHNIKKMNSSTDPFKDDIHSSLKTYLTVLACVLLLSLVEVIISLYMAWTFHKRVTKWHQKLVDKITSTAGKSPSIYISSGTPQYEKLGGGYKPGLETIQDTESPDDDGVIVLPGSSSVKMLQ